VFGGGEMVAIEEACTETGQPRGPPGSQFVDDAGRFLGTVGNQGGGDGQFHRLELVVDGLVGNRERFLALSVGREDRGFDTQNHRDHHFDQSRKEQFAGILFGGGPREEFVELLGIKKVLQRGTSQDTDRTCFDERLKIAG
jgi:hypothetical protein